MKWIEKKPVRNRNNAYPLSHMARIVLFFCIVGIPLICNCSGMVNPAAAYCRAMGYKIELVTQPDGSTDGICRMPDGTAINQWDFISGIKGLEWSYCTKQGLKAKHVEESPICRDCTVCVLENGTEVEVTALMGLDFREGTCGDGICGVPDNTDNCPADCPSGGADLFCDGEADGKCDPDCHGRIQDPDCPEEIPVPTTKAPISLFIVFLAIFVACIERTQIQKRGKQL